MQLSRDQLLRAYRQMKTIREFEERLHAEIQTGHIAGFTHLYSGQEAVAVGVCENLTDDDLKAMFAYLRTLAPVKHRVDNSLPPTYCKLCKHKHGGGEQN